MSNEILRQLRSEKDDMALESQALSQLLQRGAERAVANDFATEVVAAVQEYRARSNEPIETLLLYESAHREQQRLRCGGAACGSELVHIDAVVDHVKTVQRSAIGARQMLTIVVGAGHDE